MRYKSCKVHVTISRQEHLPEYLQYTNVKTVKAGIPEKGC